MRAQRLLAILPLLVTALLIVGACYGQVGAPITLTFEGLQDQEPVLAYYSGSLGGFGSGPGSNYGITFGSDALALIAQSTGGTGLFSGNPSGVTIVSFQSGPGVIMNVPGGFATGFSFYYTSGLSSGSVAVYDGPDGTGNLLATVNLPATGEKCNGSTYIYSCWSTQGVPFSGVAQSVDFSGVTNGIGFDNITLGSETPGSSPSCTATASNPQLTIAAPTSSDLVSPVTLTCNFDLQLDSGFIYDIDLSFPNNVVALPTASGGFSAAGNSLPSMQIKLAPQAGSPSVQTINISNIILDDSIYAGVTASTPITAQIQVVQVGSVLEKASPALAGSSTSKKTSALASTNIVASASVIVATIQPQGPVNIGSLTFAYTQGGANPPTQSVPLDDQGGGAIPFNITASSDGNWLSAAPTHGTTPATIVVSVSNLSPLQTGNHAGLLTITSPGVETSTITVTLTVSPAGAALQVSPLNLSFTANAGGASPGSQSLTVSSTTGSSGAFAVTTDGGQTGTPGPAWLIVSPASGTTPGLITATVDPSSLQANTYSARIVVTVPTDSTEQPIYVLVTLTVVSATPKLDVSPTSLSFRSTVQLPGVFEQTLVVRNVGGGGAEKFSVSVPSPIPWLANVSPTGGQATPASPVFVQVQINTQGLAVGGYKGVIRFTSADATIDVLVSLFVTKAGAVLGVSQTGIEFEYRQGQGLGTPQTINILDFGDTSSTVSFTAEIVGNTPWLTLSPASGTGMATTAQPGALTVTLNSNAQSLSVGIDYALLRISDPNAQNSPQYVIVVLNVSADTTLPVPDAFPRGLVFIGTAGGAPPPAQTVTLYTSSVASVNFQASAAAAGGAQFLTVAPTGGTVATDSPVALSIGADQASLDAGVYQTTVNLAIGTVERGVNVTFIVLPAGSAVASNGGAQSVPGCPPATSVAVTQTGQLSGYQVPGGLPTDISVMMHDNCGNIITNGSAVATFSNGDSALPLAGDGQGTYSVQWQPSEVSPQTTVTVTGTAGTLAPGTTTITGTLTPNPAPTPVLSPNGIVNNFYSAGALSPGTIAQVYGTGLASETVTPGITPLPTIYDGTTLLVGIQKAPLYYLSSGQLDVQIPELEPGQYNVIGSVNGTPTLPQTIDINLVGPAIAALPDGHTIAQHAADYKPVTTDNPAKPGEQLIIYLIGLGATNPSVASGQPAPSLPLARVTTQPVVRVDNQNAKVAFAGLTPGSVGLYQINFFVPANARHQDLDLVVVQNGVSGNTTQLTVGN